MFNKELRERAESNLKSKISKYESKVKDTQGKITSFLN